MDPVIHKKTIRCSYDIYSIAVFIFQKDRKTVFPSQFIINKYQTDNPVSSFWFFEMGIPLIISEDFFFRRS